MAQYICKTPGCEEGVEWFDGEPDHHCPHCNDRMIARANRAREWAEYHDGPCPEIEMPPGPGRSPKAPSP